MSETKISEPNGVQSAEVLEWKKSLRDRSPSPKRTTTRSRSPSPVRSNSARKTTPRKEVFSGTVPSPQGVIMTSPLRPTSSKGPKMSQSTKTMSLRKSDSSLRNSNSSPTNIRKSTGNLAAAFAKTKKSGEADGIEAEYIKNLQQQIYFLELETNYLREQAKKATDLHPKMTAEAERMISKLRVMQSDMDSVSMEKNRIESSVMIVKKEKDHLVERLRDEEEARVRDKRMLMDEVIDLKKSIARLEGDVSFKDTQLIEARNELDKSSTAIKNAETKIITLKSQLEQRIEQHKMTQIGLDEKRSELLSSETQLKAMEEKYYNSTVTLQDKMTNDLRDEIRDLRLRLKEAEMTAEQERHLRTKVSDDGSAIVRENAALSTQVTELSKQLEREKNLRDEIEARHASSISDIVHSKDREKEVRFELEYIREQLAKEQERVKQYQEQLSFKESQSTQQDLSLNTARSRVTELSSMHEHLEKESTQLRKDKALLVDHVAEVQKKLEMKTEEVVRLRSQVMNLEQKLEELMQMSSAEITSQSQKWSEFERLAESMRTLSHTMATSTKSPRSTMSLTASSKPMQY